jgi:hypothetical protein
VRKGWEGESLACWGDEGKRRRGEGEVRGYDAERNMWECEEFQ